MGVYVSSLCWHVYGAHTFGNEWYNSFNLTSIFMSLLKIAMSVVLGLCLLVVFTFPISLLLAYLGTVPIAAVVIHAVALFASVIIGGMCVGYLFFYSKDK